MILCGLVLLRPATTYASARVLKIPMSTAGISYETYRHLLSVHCTDQKTIEECDPIYAMYAGQIAFTPNGAMYMVSGFIDTPVIRPYVPDGLYKVEKKNSVQYYYVNDGVRMRLKKKNAVKRMLHLTAMHQVSVVSEIDFANMTKECVRNSNNPTTEEQEIHSACIDERNKGLMIFPQYKGRFIFRGENRGEVYYVDPFGKQDESAFLQIPQSIEKKNLSITEFLSKYSVSVPGSTIARLYSSHGGTRF